MLKKANENSNACRKTELCYFSKVLQYDCNVHYLFEVQSNYGINFRMKLKLRVLQQLSVVNVQAGLMGKLV